MMKLNKETISIRSLHWLGCRITGRCVEMLHECFKRDRPVSILDEVPENLLSLCISEELQ
ncbi:hypothetical protein DMJ13_25770 [halophilic archaeon]|nr:hypothetical protein DMJ13_25770 [halophilic archaeon]